MRSNVSANSSDYTCLKCEKSYKTEKSFLKHVCRPKAERYRGACPYCKKTFKYETMMIKHSCEIKTRHAVKETKQARIALHAYSEFMRIHMGNPATYEAFMKSRAYNAFMKFAKYILDVDAVSHREFIDHMVKSGVAVDRWCDDSQYLAFVKKKLVNETPHRALERTVILMQEWALKNQTDWTVFFNEVSQPLAVQWITTGRLSPWVVLNCRTGLELLGRLSTEQKRLIEGSINTRVWLGKFARYPAETRDIKEALEGEGL